ncbi:MAG TPA: type II toxin-antitoxin system VapC family toxin [Acidimicrobiales bacterium]|jgi:predicted nucleic acid-binding protein|nr:type II toxin-antitoxin system VapC family toxin [Acidimicrobiales bacterium]
MTTQDLLVDTSVAVPLVLLDHENHQATVDALGDRRIGLAGHAAFETLSVLTRLPPPLRRTPRAVGLILARNFPASRFLGPPSAEALLGRLSILDIAGGAVYDALVGAVAVEHQLRLATRDRRAIGTYRALNVDVEVLV